MAVLPLLGVAPRTPDARGSRHDEKSSARGRDRRPDPTGHRERELHPGAGIAVRRGPFTRSASTAPTSTATRDRTSSRSTSRPCRCCYAVPAGGYALAGPSIDASTRGRAVQRSPTSRRRRGRMRWSQLRGSEPHDPDRRSALVDPGDDRAGVPARRDRRGRLHREMPRSTLRSPTEDRQRRSGSCPARADGTFRCRRVARSPTGVNPRRRSPCADFNADGAADLAITNAGAEFRDGAAPQRRRVRPEVERRSPSAGTAEHHRAATSTATGARPRAGRVRHGLLPTAAAPDRRRLRERAGLAGEVGDGPVAIASGDFNRDGLPDRRHREPGRRAPRRCGCGPPRVSWADATPEVATRHRRERGDGGRRERRRPAGPCRRELHRQQRVAPAEQHAASASAPAAEPRQGRRRRADRRTGLRRQQSGDPPRGEGQARRRDRSELRRQGRAVSAARADDHGVHVDVSGATATACSQR